jgi:hypothetical protein
MFLPFSLVLEKTAPQGPLQLGEKSVGEQIGNDFKQESLSALAATGTKG